MAQVSHLPWAPSALEQEILVSHQLTIQLLCASADLALVYLTTKESYYMWFKKVMNLFVRVELF